MQKPVNFTCCIKMYTFFSYLNHILNKCCCYKICLRMSTIMSIYNDCLSLSFFLWNENLFFFTQNISHAQPGWPFSYVIVLLFGFSLLKVELFKLRSKYSFGCCRLRNYFFSIWLWICCFFIETFIHSLFVKCVSLHTYAYLLACEFL